MNYHLMVDDKFIDGFIENAEMQSPGKNHYIIESAEKKGQYANHPLIHFVPSLKLYFLSLKNEIRLSDKIFIHWLHDGLHDFILALPKEIKVGLFFWGGEIVQDPEEVYAAQNYEPLTLSFYNKFYRRKPVRYRVYKNPTNLLRNYRHKKEYGRVLRERVNAKYRVLARVDFFLHWNELDYNWIKERVKDFSPQFIYHFYGIGLEKDLPHQKKYDTEPLVFWLGNSATLSNNHLDALELLKAFKGENIKVICPLSYGDNLSGHYTQSVIEKGKQIFKEKFVAITEFLSRSAYYNLFNEVNIVVMHHNRTQAAGNTAAFLLMGKKLFMQSASTFFQLLVNKKAHVYDNATLSKVNFAELKKPLSDQQLLKNKAVVEEILNYERKMKSLSVVLN